jgi:hypothetical protein
VSKPRRSLGPVIAYMLTLLGLVLGGIWVWNALRTRPAPRAGPQVGLPPPRVRPEVGTALAPRTGPEAHPGPPQTAGTGRSGEDLTAADRQRLENILRQKSAGERH